MTAEGPERPLRLSDWLVAALLAVGVLALALATIVQLGRAESARHAADAEEAAGQVAAGVGVDLGAGLRGVALAATSPFAAQIYANVSNPGSIAPGATAAGFVPVAGDAPAEGARPLLSAEDRTSPPIATALARAQDLGLPQLTAPLGREDGPRALIIAASYAPGTIPGPPLTSTDRRERITGWVVAAVDVGRLSTDHAPEGTEVTVTDSSAANPAEARADAGTEEQLVDVGGRRLLVEADVESTPVLSRAAVIIGLAGGLFAVAVAGLFLSARRRASVAEAGAEARGAQVRLIGEVAPLVQQSLELGDVLPSVAVQLSDHFDLVGVVLSSGTTRGEQVEMFSLGVEPDAAMKTVLQPPAKLEPGETLRLALQRGGRNVAVLAIVAGRPLGVVELESLRALSELVTAALVNASLYASQQEALRRMRELDGLKTVFLGTASHELRTPATAIAGFAGLLTASWDRFNEDQRRDFVNRIGANARSLSTVVQDLLDFSLLDRGSLSIALEPVDLSAVVGGVLDRLAPAFGDHTLEVDLQPTDLVDGDGNGLERVTTNLLTNAVKFSPAGTTISVAVRQDGDDVLLEVSDQGPGVPAEERERVFTRFYRGTGDVVIQTRGVGIGLSVVSEFVARMNGEVSVDDAPGGGARFTVRLPIAPAQNNEEVADAASP